MRGGYKIIDFKKAAFTSGEAANISGAYVAAQNPYNKATMISGLVVSDVEYPDFYAPFVANGNNMGAAVVIGGRNITITIANTDDVTVTVA